MKEFKGTKGEWINDNGTIVNPNYDPTIDSIKTIAVCYAGFGNDSIAERDANAKLIRSSLELFKVAKYALRMLKNSNAMFDVEYIESAIKKATE